jgi:ubiquinone/menaquinone biosynthesis C-methylase UbiE
MVDTAASNGIPWIQCREWLENQSEWILTDDEYAEPPAYYLQPFHAYDKGNLCWEAAWEAEIASAAVGARNFPLYGSKGETAFRTCFQESLQEIGATVPDNAVIVDLGCGTGMSTRWIAQHYPQASRILGIDLSPFMIAVGRKLLEAAPKSVDEGGTWINAIQQDKRIEYRIGAAENTGLPDNSVDIVNLQFVAHEMPANVTLQVLTEAHRILKTGGQVWFCEMDFEAPAYAAQRANPLLFSLIRSTEPYLDDYADGAQEFRHQIKRLFDYTKLSAATGRHFAVVAIKGSSSQEHVLEDLRFDQHGNYAVEDTHLQVWENKL